MPSTPSRTPSATSPRVLLNTGFYSLVLLLYGALSFVMVRLFAMLTLKLTHLLTNAGMSFFGAWSSAKTATFTKLSAMWEMPAWGELSLLPTTDGIPFWGTFHNAPLSGTELFALFFIRCWVYLVVGLVGSYVVSFFFCGSTQMYVLLRRDVDSVDYDEIFFEENEEDLPPPEPAAQPAEATEEPPANDK